MGISAPCALSEREQRELLRKFRECGDMAAREKLVETSMRLVYHIAKRYREGVLSDDDLAGAGSLGLVKAVNAYDLGRNTRFSTFAGRCIENEILMELRSWNRRKKMETLSLEEPIGSDGEGNDMFLMDILSVDAGIEEEVLDKLSSFHVSRSDMEESGLKERDMAVICLRFGLDSDGERCTQREIAERLGLSRSYVSRIERKALLKLRKKYKALAT